jgi:hypothetical protein
MTSERKRVFKKKFYT